MWKKLPIDLRHLYNSDQVRKSLEIADKDVTRLRYPNQGHVFEGEGLRDLYTREMAFLQNI